MGWASDMLQYLHIAEVQLLLASFLGVLAYAGIVTATNSHRWKLSALCMVLVFAASYGTIASSDAVLGRPAWISGEATGILGGYLTFDHGGGAWIAVLINTDQGPRLLAVPHTQSEEEMLEKGMRDWVNLGSAQVVRKRRDGAAEQGSPGDGGENDDGNTGRGNGSLRFYEFNQDFLQKKPGHSP